MGLRVDTHIASIDAPRPQWVAERPAWTRRLGAGLRITSAADDSGLAPADRLRLSVRSLERTRRGNGDGSSLQQQAAIVLDEVSSILTRVRELSANGASQRSEAAATDARIRDAGTALATAQATRNSILRQATSVVRAQANVLPQSALRLLG